MAFDHKIDNLSLYTSAIDHKIVEMKYGSDFVICALIVLCNITVIV